jgi:hypothetical protein
MPEHREVREGEASQESREKRKSMVESGKPA